MIKLFETDKSKQGNPEPININFSLSANVSVDMREELIDWMREEIQEKLYEKAKDDGCDLDLDADDIHETIFESAHKEAAEKSKNPSDEDLSKFIESMYSFKFELVDMIMEKSNDSDVSLSASMSRPLSSITN